MTALFDNIHVALPEIIVLITTCLALLADLFLKKWCKSIALIIASVGLVAAAVISFLLLGNFSAVVLGGLFISDDSAQLMKIFITLTVLLSFLYSQQYIQDREISSGDYYVLGLFSTML